MSDKFTQEQYFDTPKQLTQTQIDAAAKLVASTVAQNRKDGYLGSSDLVEGFANQTPQEEILPKTRKSFLGITIR